MCASFLRAEKLEFSTLRHSKYISMMLLYALRGRPCPERFHDATASAAVPPPPASTSAAPDAQPEPAQLACEALPASPPDTSAALTSAAAVATADEVVPGPPGQHDS